MAILGDSYWKERAEAAEARLASLEEALRRVVTHKGGAGFIAQKALAALGDTT